VETTEELGDIVATAIPLGGAILLPDVVALCSEACLGVAPHVEALGWIPLIMTVVAIVVHPEKVPGMVQKNMIEVVQTPLVGNCVNAWDPLDNTQRNLIRGCRTQDDLNLPVD
jgi:hypothetical protein